MRRLNENVQRARDVEAGLRRWIAEEREIFLGMPMCVVLTATLWRRLISAECASARSRSTARPSALRGLAVHDHLKLGRQLNGQLRRLRAAQNAIDLSRGATPDVYPVDSVGEQAAVRIDGGMARPSALGGLKVHDHLKFCRKLNGKVPRLLAAQDAIHISGCATKGVYLVDSVGE
jgi:hypothetical protein